MSIFVVGDLHLHTWPYKAIRDYQDRLLGEIIPSKVKRLHPELVVFLGDIFHVKKVVDKRVLSQFSDMLTEIAKRASGVYIVAGNHDMYEGEVTLDFLSVDENVIVVKEFQSIKWNNRQLIFIPYYHQNPVTDNEFTDAEQYIIQNTYDPNKEVLVFSHVDVSPIPYTPSYTPARNKSHIRLDVLSNAIEEGLNAKKVLIINGHYHTPLARSISNRTEVIMVGSAFGFTRTDAGQQKIFIDLKFDSSNESWFYETIPTESPVVVIAKNRAEYEQLTKLDSEKHVVFFSPMATAKPITDNNTETDKGLDFVSLVMQAMKSLAKEKGISDTKFGEKLIKEALNVE